MSLIQGASIHIANDEDESMISLIDNNAVVRYTTRIGIGKWILLRLQEQKTNIVFLAYSLILLAHFIGWVLFSMYASVCFFTQHSTTQRCKNFDYFNHPKELEVCWQVMTGINAIVYIVLVRKLRFADGSSFSFKNLRKVPTAILPMIAALSIANAYETVAFCHEENPSARAIEVGFIWRNICVASLVFFLNFTRPPVAIKFKVLYYLTLAVFFLDQLVMSSLMIGHVHYRINAVKKTNLSIEGDVHKSSSKDVVISMMTFIGVFSLHSSLLKFFWEKMFNIATKTCFKMDTFRPKFTAKIQKHKVKYKFDLDTKRTTFLP